MSDIANILEILKNYLSNNVEAQRCAIQSIDSWSTDSSLCLKLAEVLQLEENPHVKLLASKFLANSFRFLEVDGGLKQNMVCCNTKPDETKVLPEIIDKELSFIEKAANSSSKNSYSALLALSQMLDVLSNYKTVAMTLAYNSSDRLLIRSKIFEICIKACDSILNDYLGNLLLDSSDSDRENVLFTVGSLLKTCYNICLGLEDDAIYNSDELIYELVNYNANSRIFTTSIVAVALKLAESLGNKPASKSEQTIKLTLYYVEILSMVAQTKLSYFVKIEHRHTHTLSIMSFINITAHSYINLFNSGSSGFSSKTTSNSSFVGFCRLIGNNNFFKVFSSLLVNFASTVQLIECRNVLYREELIFISELNVTSRSFDLISFLNTLSEMSFCQLMRLPFFANSTASDVENDLAYPSIHDFEYFDEFVNNCYSIISYFAELSKEKSNLMFINQSSRLKAIVSKLIEGILLQTFLLFDVKFRSLMFETLSDNKLIDSNNYLKKLNDGFGHTANQYFSEGLSAIIRSIEINIPCCSNVCFDIVSKLTDPFTDESSCNHILDLTSNIFSLSSTTCVQMIGLIYSCFKGVDRSTISDDFDKLLLLNRSSTIYFWITCLMNSGFHFVSSSSMSLTETTSGIQVSYLNYIAQSMINETVKVKPSNELSLTGNLITELNNIKQLCYDVLIGDDEAQQIVNSHNNFPALSYLHYCIAINKMMYLLMLETCTESFFELIGPTLSSTQIEELANKCFERTISVLLYYIHLSSLTTAEISKLFSLRNSLATKSFNLFTRMAYTYIRRSDDNSFNSLLLFVKIGFIESLVLRDSTDQCPLILIADFFSSQPGLQQRFLKSIITACLFSICRYYDAGSGFSRNYSSSDLKKILYYIDAICSLHIKIKIDADPLKNELEFIRIVVNSLPGRIPMLLFCNYLMRNPRDPLNSIVGNYVSLLSSLLNQPDLEKLVSVTSLLADVLSVTISRIGGSSDLHCYDYEAFCELNEIYYFLQKLILEAFLEVLPNLCTVVTEILDRCSPVNDDSSKQGQTIDFVYILCKNIFAFTSSIIKLYTLKKNDTVKQVLSLFPLNFQEQLANASNVILMLIYKYSNENLWSYLQQNPELACLEDYAYVFPKLSSHLNTVKSNLLSNYKKFNFLCIDTLNSLICFDPLKIFLKPPAEIHCIFDCINNNLFSPYLTSSYAAEQALLALMITIISRINDKTEVDLISFSLLLKPKYIFNNKPLDNTQLVDQKITKFLEACLAYNNSCLLMSLELIVSQITTQRSNTVPLTTAVQICLLIILAFVSVDQVIFNNYVKTKCESSVSWKLIDEFLEKIAIETNKIVYTSEKIENSTTDSSLSQPKNFFGVQLLIQNILKLKCFNI